MKMHRRHLSALTKPLALGLSLQMPAMVMTCSTQKLSYQDFFPSRLSFNQGVYCIKQQLIMKIVNYLVIIKILFHMRKIHGKD